MIKLTFDPDSGAFYMRVREGEYEETVPLAEPGFGASVDIDREGNVLGLEFLSFAEYAELLARHGGALELPERVENPPVLPLNLRSPQTPTVAEAGLAPRRRKLRAV